MAVRIVKEEPDPKVVKKKVCRNCGVTIEYLLLDIQEFSKTDYAGGTETWRAIVCPKCKNQIHCR